MLDSSILVIDDEQHILDLASLYLEREGYQVQTALDGMSGFEMAISKHPDLIVLDLMLPRLDGFEICRRLRAEKNETPILILTARDDDVDKIVGLELGADDYLTKPFNPREMIARIKAILRRVQRQVTEKSEVLRVGDLTVYLDRREVFCGDEMIALRAQEFELLTELLRNKGMVLSREKLLNRAWGFDFAGETRTVDVHIAHLRKKLSQCALTIETVTGIGYKLVA